MARSPIGPFVLRDKPDLCKNCTLNPSLLSVLTQNLPKEKAPVPPESSCPLSEPSCESFCPPFPGLPKKMLPPAEKKIPRAVSTPRSQRVSPRDRTGGQIWVYQNSGPFQS